MSAVHALQHPTPSRRAQRLRVPAVALCFTLAVGLAPVACNQPKSECAGCGDAPEREPAPAAEQREQTRPEEAGEHAQTEEEREAARAEEERKEREARLLAMNERLLVGVRRYIDVGRLTKGRGSSSRRPKARISAPVVPTAERYGLVGEEGFLDVTRHPLSTFSIDVDTASYANVRRLLREGRLPPKGAVRIEELVNYFDYFDRLDLEHERGADQRDVKTSPGAPFTLVTEVMPAPWKPEHSLVMIGLQGRRIAAADVPPRNLTFLVDVSGSMRGRLPLVVRAMARLVETLRAEDRVAIVVYAGASGLLLPPTSGAERARILDALASLQAGGGTNGAGGIRMAYEVARVSFQPGGVNRVILATDGDFNLGVSDDSTLVELIENERESGVYLTVIGVGRWNLNDAMMEKLADHGNGNYAYFDTPAEARKVFVEESGATLVTIAKDVKIQLEFNPQHVAAYRLIGYENRRLADEDFNDDRKDAGEIGAGHDVTALYEIVPAGTPVPSSSVDALRYQLPAGGPDRAPAGEPGLRDELMTVKLRYKDPAVRPGQGKAASKLLTHHVERAGDGRRASDDLRFASAVAMFGLLLRESPYRGDGSYDVAFALARGATGRDPRGYRAEFVRLIAEARALSQREHAAFSPDP